ncbi:hypothetical protein OAT84_04125, partial [Gammaproteobacteria bacterium]|nr:hypothetical protein [Gammaproteobacteria bacterium]
MPSNGIRDKNLGVYDEVSFQNVLQANTAYQPGGSFGRIKANQKGRALIESLITKKLPTPSGYGELSGEELAKAVINKRLGDEVDETMLKVFLNLNQADQLDCLVSGKKYERTRHFSSKVAEKAVKFNSEVDRALSGAQKRLNAYVRQIAKEPPAPKPFSGWEIVLSLFSFGAYYYYRCNVVDPIDRTNYIKDQTNKLKEFSGGLVRAVKKGDEYYSQGHFDANETDASFSAKINKFGNNEYVFRRYLANRQVMDEVIKLPRVHFGGVVFDRVDLFP